MSRLSCNQNFSCVHRAFKSLHIQTSVRSKLPMSRLSCAPKENSCASKLIICAVMSRLSCVQKTLCPDFRAFKMAYVQTFVQSKFFVRSSCVQKSSNPDFRAFKIAYFQTLVRSKGKFVRFKIDNLFGHVQTIVRSKDLMSRLSCVQNGLCPDFRAIKIFRAFIVRSKV